MEMTTFAPEEFIWGANKRRLFDDFRYTEFEFFCVTRLELRSFERNNLVNFTYIFLKPVRVPSINQRTNEKNKQKKESSID